MTTKLDKETLNYDPLLRCEEHDEENCISCACKLILAYRTALLEAVRRLHRTNWGWVDTVRALGAAVKEAQTERDEARAALENERDRAENKRLRRIEKAARAVLADRIIHDNQHGECECPSCSKLRAALEEKP